VDNLRVVDLVNHMRDAARLSESSHERAEVSGLPSDLTEISQRVIHRLQPLGEAQKVEATIHSATQINVGSSADEPDVLISHLVMNAIQHTSAGGIVEIMLDASDGLAILIVNDSGHGISPEALPHVFERFYREDPSRSRETGGAGLGLSIYKALVEAASGTIAIESAIGLGTKVRVTLPLLPPPSGLKSSV
jgi:signal transduction histidine kinase